MNASNPRSSSANAPLLVALMSRAGVTVPWLFAALIWGSTIDARADESLAERRERIAQMDPQQQEQLSQNFERFARLDESERERLRTLHQQLEAARDKDHLRKVMQRYHEWLAELSPAQRAEIMALSPEERLEKIDQIRAVQNRQDKLRLSPADLEVVDAWIHKYDLPRRFASSMHRGKSDNDERPTVNAAELDELRTKLSDDARQKLDAATSMEAKRRLLFYWASQTMRRGGPGGSGGPSHVVFRRPTESELQEFLHKEVRDTERTELLNLPYDEMQFELRRMWMAHEFRKNRRPFNDRDAGPPGSGPDDRRGPGDDRRRRGPGDTPERDRFSGERGPGEKSRRPPPGDRAPETKPAAPAAGATSSGASETNQR